MSTKSGKAKNLQGGGKLAAYCGKYSNPSSAAGYRSAIQSFLRCMYGLPKLDAAGKKVAHDYEGLFDEYLADKKRDKVADISAFSACLVRESVSRQSARQQMTYAVKFLRAHGINILKDDVQDLKRENKGGAATVDRVMTADVICKALKGSDVRSRAMVVMLASSGLRVGELLALASSDVDLNMSPVMVTVRAEHSKTGQPRYTFITPEATEALKEYLAVKDTFSERANVRAAALGNKPRQDTAGLLFPFEYSTVNKMWETLLRKSGLYVRDERSSRNQYRIHSLRKFFISQLSIAGARTLAEHLAGHSGYLDQSYRQISPEFAAREYLKLQSVLTVCIPESIKNGIKLADEKIGVLMEKTELQSESLTGLRMTNDALLKRLN